MTWCDVTDCFVARFILAVTARRTSNQASNWNKMESGQAKLPIKPKYTPETRALALAQFGAPESSARLRAKRRHQGPVWNKMKSGTERPNEFYRTNLKWHNQEFHKVFKTLTIPMNNEIPKHYHILWMEFMTLFVTHVSTPSARHP